METDSERFGEVFNQVKDSSGRTRAALYVFMIINFALFLTVYGSDLYRRPIERLDDFVTAIVCAKNKLKDSETPIKNSNLNCEAAKQNASFQGYDLDQSKDAPLSGEGGSSASLHDVLIRKRLEALVSEEVTSKHVQIPFVGFTDGS